MAYNIVVAGYVPPLPRELFSTFLFLRHLFRTRDKKINKIKKIRRLWTVLLVVIDSFRGAHPPSNVRYGGDRCVSLMETEEQTRQLERAVRNHGLATRAGVLEHGEYGG